MPAWPNNSPLAERGSGEAHNGRHAALAFSVRACSHHRCLHCRAAAATARAVKRCKARVFLTAVQQ
ncbi:hypothetical protein NC00_02240 [Xanthomonas cannabis pv. phaseoli]|uniref:Uncharacterized protein n=1 Tax=Xanthomonas cannabis pv. phaseoli TaxID=1885902 RepID=A0AB34PCW4_9XANT|nr:hypothetical protein NC00_02240 [Xanthomonas cannabis pv. phaseoli]